MSIHAGPEIINDNLVFKYDMTNIQKSWKGTPTTNYVPSADTMPSWGGYGAGNDGTFITEFGTTGYQMLNRGSWNGIARGITLPSTGTYTFSAWVKYAGGSANNNGGTVYISGWGGGDSAVTTNKSLTGVWQRLSITLNCTTTSVTFYLISYGGTNDGVSDRSTWYVTMPQAEAGSTATPFVNGTRSNTQALLDVTGNNTITANSLTYASDNTFSFNGSSNYIDSGPIALTGTATQSITWACWVKPTTGTGDIINMVYPTAGWNMCPIWASGQVFYAKVWSNPNLTSGTTFTLNQYYYLVLVRNNATNTNSFYIDGQLVASNIGAYSSSGFANNHYFGRAGSQATNTFFNGQIPTAQIYTRALSADEIFQNFTAFRARFGL